MNSGDTQDVFISSSLLQTIQEQMKKETEDVIKCLCVLLHPNDTCFHCFHCSGRTLSTVKQFGMRVLEQALTGNMCLHADVK